MRVACLSLLIACSPNLAELERDNTAAEARATKNRAEAGTAFTPASVSIADLSNPNAPRGAGASTAHLSQPADPRALLGDERVGVLDDGRLVFIGAYCVAQAHCSNECSEWASYSFATAADRHVIVTRTYRRLEAVASEDDPHCAASCGGAQQGPPVRAESTLASVLGNLTPGQVEIRDNGFTIKYVAHNCTNTTPVP